MKINDIKNKSKKTARRSWSINNESSIDWPRESVHQERVTHQRQVSVVGSGRVQHAARQEVQVGGHVARHALHQARRADPGYHLRPHRRPVLQGPHQVQPRSNIQQVLTTASTLFTVLVFF